MPRASFSTARRRKAPVTLFSFRSVLLAVFVAALLAALTAAASPFVTTAAGSEALSNRLNELSPYATGLQIDGPLPGPDYRVNGSRQLGELERVQARRVAAVQQLASSLHGVGSPVFTLELGTTYAHTSAGDDAVRLMSRTDALDHVRIVSKTSGPGVWISDLTASLGHLKLGGKLAFTTAGTFNSEGKEVSFRIKGIYHALSRSPQTPYWANLFRDIYPPTNDISPPPSYVFVSTPELLRMLQANGGSSSTLAAGAVGGGTVSSVYELPVDPKGLTLAEARRLDAQFTKVENDLREPAFGAKFGCATGNEYSDSCVSVSSLSSAVLLADRNVSAVKVPVSLLAYAGTAIALAVAAAAGMFLVRRRRAEVALGYARGEHVGAFATRTFVEVFMPAFLGAAAGFGLAFGLTSVFAPAGSTDSATVQAGLLHGAVAVVVAIALLVGTASFGFLRLFDTGSRSISWLRWVPWELPLLAIAIYLLVQITTGSGLSGDASTGAAHPTLGVFVFPLLFVAAIAGLLSRLARLALRLSSKRTARTRRIPLYLALRRLAAARGLLVVLAVVTATALGAFCYAESLATSLNHTTIEKAYIGTGSDAEASIPPGQPMPKHFPYPITAVEFANQSAMIDRADGIETDVMMVDPATLLPALHWESDWGTNPSALLRELATAPSSPLPVIVTTSAAGMKSFFASGVRFPVHVLGTVKSFPGMAAGIPLVITSTRAMNAAQAHAKLNDPFGVVQAYVWGKGPPDAVEQALGAPSLESYYPSSITTFLRDPNVLLATRTYAFMRTVAIASAVLVLLGLLLYLQARQRSQVIGSALGRRMGFGLRGEVTSVGLEVLAILVFAGVIGGGIAIAAAGPVVRHIDPLPADAPSPIFSLPLTELVVAGGCLVLVAVLAGLLTTWFARRADVNEELRVA